MLELDQLGWEKKKVWQKELWSQKIKYVSGQIGLGYLWTKAHENDIGILNIIKQRLKDIELQRWLSDVNNDVRKDANQKNKLRTFQNFKTIENYKCEEPWSMREWPSKWWCTFIVIDEIGGWHPWTGPVGFGEEKGMTKVFKCLFSWPATDSPLGLRAYG